MLSMRISIKFIVVVAGDLSPSINECECVSYFQFEPTHFRTRQRTRFQTRSFVVRD